MAAKWRPQGLRRVLLVHCTSRYNIKRTGRSSSARGNDRPSRQKPGDERTPARAECDDGRVIVGAPSASVWSDGLGPMVGKSMAGRAWFSDIFWNPNSCWSRYNIVQRIFLMIRHITRRAFKRAFDARNWKKKNSRTKSTERRKNVTSVVSTYLVLCITFYP